MSLVRVEGLGRGHMELTSSVTLSEAMQTIFERGMHGTPVLYAALLISCRGVASCSSTLTSAVRARSTVQVGLGHTIEWNLIHLFPTDNSI